MNTQQENQEAECTQVSEALSAHFDGAANDAEQQLATAHLARCSSCAQMWREWQNLRLMEQRALEPVASGEMLPLAPVKIPRHLKAAILRQTVSPPIWQKFWPRVLTGMAVPTVAVACWLLVVAAPWQQPLPEISVPSNPVPENRVATIPEKPASTSPRVGSLSVTSKNPKEVIEDKPEKATLAETGKSIIINESKSSHSNYQTKSRTVSVAKVSRKKPSSRVATASTDNNATKSTFIPKLQTENKEPRTPIKTPQISMASLEQPTSRAAKPAISETAEPITTVATKPRATEPILVATIPEHDTPSVTEDISNPVLEYIAANDVRPDDIRLAVENYRAALLDAGSDL